MTTRSGTTPLDRLRAALRRTVPAATTGSCANCGLPTLDAPLSRFCSEECRSEHPARPAADVGATRDTVVSAGTRPHLVPRDAARETPRPSPRPRPVSRPGVNR